MRTLHIQLKLCGKYNNNNNNNNSSNNGSQIENVSVSERRNEMQLNVHTEISMYNCLVGIMLYMKIMRKITKSQYKINAMYRIPVPMRKFDAEDKVLVKIKFCLNK